MNSLWQWDLEVFRSVHTSRQGWLDDLVQVVSDTGLGHAQLTALAAAAMKNRLHWGWIAAWSALVMAATAWYEGSKYGKGPHVAAAYLVCLALFWRLPSKAAWWALGCGVISGLLRLIWVRPLGRERPSNLWFSQPMEPIFGATSFPSGHTTTSAAIAVFIWWISRGSREAWIGWAALTWAASVGLARIYVGVHYPADIVAALALGAMVATAIWMIIGQPCLDDWQDA